jgi:hypothetical protein
MNALSNEPLFVFIGQLTAREDITSLFGLVKRWE